MQDSSSFLVEPRTGDSPAKRRPVRELALGAEVRDVFLISSAQQGQARNGPYWRLELGDATGSLGAKIWSPQSREYPDLAPGMLVQARGRVTSYRDRLELAVEGLRVLTEEESAALDPALFMPASPYRPEVMLEDLRRLCRAVFAHKPWRRLVLGLLGDAEIARDLPRAPAAKGMHHAYAGGLLEHTLSVARLCMRIADHYPDLDRQALLAGAVCHDLGKLWELSPGPGTDYTTPGRLLGHISLVLERLAPFIKKSGLAPELAEHLQHLVLSHHGTLEFGSPKVPATAEALVLHYADNIDAKLQQVRAALSSLGEEESGWSAYNSGLERFLFRAVPTPEDFPRERGGADIAACMASGASPLPDPPPPRARVKTARPPEAAAEPLPLISQCSLLSKE